MKMKTMTNKNYSLICFVSFCTTLVFSFGITAIAESDYSQISLEELKLLTDSDSADISALNWIKALNLPAQQVLDNQTSSLQSGSSFATTEAAANNTSQVKTENDLVISKNPTTDASQQLWQSRIQSSKEPEHNKTKDEVQELIRKIGAVEFEVAEPDFEPFEPFVEETQANVEQIEENPAEKVDSPNAAKDSDESLSNETLETLQAAAQNSKDLLNPFELAEILFNSNHLKEASNCYLEALRRIEENKSDSKNKPWILLQIGNCLQNTDTQKALDSYRQMIAEYPDSPWTDMAQAKTRLINWTLIDKPQELLEQNKK